MGTGGSHLGDKRLGREADHSPLSMVEVRNGCNCTCMPTIHLHDVPEDNFTFYLHLQKYDLRRTEVLDHIQAWAMVPLVQKLYAVSARC
jgi:hypothetical protein